MAAVNLKCRLGKVGSPDEHVAVDTSRAGSNSNRWIIDVELDARIAQGFNLQLLDNRTGAPKQSGYVSHSLAPLNDLAAAARLHFAQPDLPVLHVKVNSVKGVVKYRIAIDVAHSLMR